MLVKMTLCTTCESLDFAALLKACLRDCRQRQAPDCQDYDEELATPQPYQKDIFQIQDSAKTCDLCKIIFQAFGRRKPSNIKDASDVPIVLRSQSNNVEVLYEVEGRYVKLCDLHWYVSGGVVENAFRGLEIVENTRPPIHRMIHRDPKSRASYKIASRWLQHCILNHKSCKSTIDGRQFPRRLLWVGDENQNPRLIETDASFQPLEWAALSYCWGDQASDKLIGRSMDRLKNGIPTEDLDPTIRDAVLVTRALGLPYVWIDALCVSQEQDAKEWEEEAARMDVVYGRSTVTIVAASSHSTIDGFLKERDVQYAQVPTTQNSSAKIFLAAAPQSSFDVTDGPWIKRGWTFQESLLPNRILYYTSSQMVWRCCAEHRSEKGITDSYQHRFVEAEKHAEDISYGSGWLWRQDAFTQLKLLSSYLPMSPSYPIGSSLETFRLWYTLVETYSQRHFTKEDDRLTAISGLARIVGRMLKIDGYVAGLWKKDIIRGLLWYTDGSKLFNPFTQSTKPPTWSWASVGSQSISHCLSKDNYTALCKIEDVCADLVDRDAPFHSVNGGRITISGPFRRLPGLLHGKSRLIGASLSLLEGHVLKVLRTEKSTHILPGCTAPSGGHFAMLQVARSSPYLHMLLLESAGGTSNVNVYKRIGVCTLQYVPTKSAASPALVKMIKESENSLAVRLDPSIRSAGWQLTGHEALKEIDRKPWDEETVIIA